MLRHRHGTVNSDPHDDYDELEMTYASETPFRSIADEPDEREALPPPQQPALLMPERNKAPRPADPDDYFLPATPQDHGRLIQKHVDEFDRELLAKRENAILALAGTLKQKWRYWTSPDKEEQLDKVDERDMESRAKQRAKMWLVFEGKKYPIAIFLLLCFILLLRYVDIKGLFTRPFVDSRGRVIFNPVKTFADVADPTEAYYSEWVKENSGPVGALERGFFTSPVWQELVPRNVSTELLSKALRERCKERCTCISAHYLGIPRNVLYVKPDLLFFDAIVDGHSTSQIVLNARRVTGEGTVQVSAPAWIILDGHAIDGQRERVTLEKIPAACAFSLLVK